MRRHRRILFLLFPGCLVAAMPYAWGQAGLADANLAPPASLEEATSQALKVGVTLCHIPPGNPANAQTIFVGQAAVAAHLAHGDYLGECHPARAGGPSPVPKTGQTTCWDINGYVVDCAGTGQDGEYQKGVSVDPRFTDNGDGTVKDNMTGLIWLKDVNCLRYDVWFNALTLSRTLASGSCGLTDGSVAGDWRLPNRKELESLLDLGTSYPALPLGHPFPGFQNDIYWSSTTFAPDPSSAWGVHLGFGFASDVFKYSYGFVWPIRGGQ